MHDRKNRAWRTNFLPENSLRTIRPEPVSPVFSQKASTM